MSDAWKDDAWRATVGAQDDVRHTYERVFFGRQLTDNNADHLKDTTAPAKEEPAYPFHPREGEVLPPEEAGGGSIYGEGPTISPAADALGRYQQALLKWQGQGVTGAPEPGAGAPQIEAPTIEQPGQDNDLTPGY